VAAVEKVTRAVDVRNRIRDDILGGRLRPGQRLIFPAIAERYGASVGVTREALTWLVTQGLVRVQAHQGHIVSPLSKDDLQDLATARLSIEPLVLSDSISNRSLEWEARIVAAHHVMAGSFAAMTSGRGENDPLATGQEVDDEWAAAHAAFHDALFSGCRNRRLLAITRTLAEEAALYRRWSDSLASPRDVMEEHRALMEAAIHGDEETAVLRLRDHVARTATSLIQAYGDVDS
jgi:DNA-binding GntR family transcriptional regulator